MSIILSKKLAEVYLKLHYFICKRNNRFIPVLEEVDEKIGNHDNINTVTQYNAPEIPSICEVEHDPKYNSQNSRQAN